MQVVWGRAAIDNKHNLLMQLSAIEMLLTQGFKLRRTVFFAYGHDEEVGGTDGAQKIAESLIERGITFEFMLDEGAFVISDAVPGLHKPVAYVCNAEKGFVNVELEVDAVPSCHSSMPPAETSMGYVL